MARMFGTDGVRGVANGPVLNYLHIQIIYHEKSITYSYPFVFLFAIRKSRRSKDDLNLNQ